MAEPRGIDWAMTNGAAGVPTTLCAVVMNILPSHRGTGLASVLLRRMNSLAAAHGFDALIAPVRPTWKERYPLTPIERYVHWRREDGLPYDPWLRMHERARRDDARSERRVDDGHGVARGVGGVDGLQFPEDGDYIVPRALVPVRFENGVARTSSRTSGCGTRSTRTEAGLAAALAVALGLFHLPAHLAVRRLRVEPALLLLHVEEGAALLAA